MPSLVPLPTPDPQAAAHSLKLCQHIRRAIELDHGYIPFSRFMELALYAPGLGYYSAGMHKFGKGGDFSTAPEISPLFAKSIAQQCQQILHELDSGDILEIGAGSGRFAKDLLLELEELQCLPSHYYILEISAELRERQNHLLKKYCPHLYDRVHWLEQMPIDFYGIIFANEVLDAIPVDCFTIEKNNILEKGVAWDQDQLMWQVKPAREAILQRVREIQKECELSSGYQSEVNLMATAWMHTLAHSLKKGVILLFDYGYGRREYYHPERVMGTLMCHYQHRRHDNPLILVGLQDITAHVDFTAVTESAIDAGLSLAGFTTQAAFLLACGLTQFAELAAGTPLEIYEQSQMVRKLTLPAEMGELIKVIAFTQHYPAPLKGFDLQDRRRDL